MGSDRTRGGRLGLGQDNLDANILRTLRPSLVRDQAHTVGRGGKNSGTVSRFHLILAITKLRKKIILADQHLRSLVSPEGHATEIDMIQISLSHCLVLLHEEKQIRYSSFSCNRQLIIRDLTQQDGWKIQDGRMPKNVARDCAFRSCATFLYVILPS